MWSNYPNFKSMIYFHVVNETISKHNACDICFGLPYDEGSTSIEFDNSVDYDYSIRVEDFMNHCDVVSFTN